MKKLNLIGVAVFLLLASCTFGYNIKNKALVLSAESFDQEVEKRGKDAFADAEQQKAYTELLRKNSRMELKSFAMKGENEATGDLEVETVPKALDAEFAKTPNKDWDAKFKATAKVKSYPLHMRKTDSWQLDPVTF